jgi:cytochrome b561/polyisoprenoid-binding protein YceI
MPLANTRQTYGSAARTLHWLTALLILTALALGLYSKDLPTGSDAEVATAAWLFSLHKTVGIAAFFVALVRILWAIAQPRPGALHPDRRLETLAADTMHWALYGAMLVMPLSGWLYHSTTTGFAPILWPFGQDLPLVPKSESLGHVFSAIHGIASNILIVAVALHTLGALKHAVIDRDATLARMIGGTPPEVPLQQTARTPMLAAAAIWAAVIAAGLAAGSGGQNAPVMPGPVAGGNWQVTEGTLTFTVRQMASEVTGSFAGWTAEITYDAESKSGHVTVDIPLSGLSLGVVTQQVLGPEFFDAATHPNATFDANIAEIDAMMTANGTLTLRGVQMPVAMPILLAIDGDTATATGSVTLDRRDFGMGPSYPDETTVGFAVVVDMALTATRK